MEALNGDEITSGESNYVNTEIFEKKLNSENNYGILQPENIPMSYLSK